jgi:hypothetical protein
MQLNAASAPATFLLIRLAVIVSPRKAVAGIIIK